jgi:hypothetical protein
MCCRTNCCKKLSLIIALLAMAVLAAPAFAQNCLQDEFTLAGNSQNVNCTAGDVRIAAVKNVQVIGGVGNKCLAGQPFSFIADFEILTTSKSSRSNVGLYFGTGTGPNQIGALKGTCTDSIIAPQHPCANGSFTCGTAQYAELDGNPQVDNCGDTSSTDSSPAFGAGTEDVVIEIDNVTCPLSGNSLSLPECTSWQVPGKQLNCLSPAPSFPYEITAIPGSPSKCSCGTLSIPVQPIVPSVTVAKGCDIGSDTTPHLSCDAGAETHDVIYTVTITNTTPAQEGGVIVDQICDNRYGQIYPTSGGTCAAGTVGTISSTTCPPSPNDIANGGSGSCTFTVSHGENLTVTDTVTVAGHSDLAPTELFGPTSSNTVTVNSEDAPSAATITKGLVTTLADCATVRYSVDVHNDSGFDETETLSNLTDSAYGQIIPNTSANIIATTCTVPQTLAAGADYTCTFDAQFCGVTGPVEEFGTGTCGGDGFCSAGLDHNHACTKNSDCDLTCPLGISHTNTVSSGTITSDEGETVTETDHQLIVNECLASFTQSN